MTITRDEPAKEVSALALSIAEALDNDSDRVVNRMSIDRWAAAVIIDVLLARHAALQASEGTAYDGTAARLHHEMHHNRERQAWGLVLKLASVSNLNAMANLAKQALAELDAEGEPKLSAASGQPTRRDWIVIQGKRLRCLRCGLSYTPRLPASLNIYAAICKAFTADHRRCSEKKA